MMVKCAFLRIGKILDVDGKINQILKSFLCSVMYIYTIMLCEFHEIVE